MTDSEKRFIPMKYKTKKLPSCHNLAYKIGFMADELHLSPAVIARLYRVKPARVKGILYWRRVGHDILSRPAFFD